LTLVKIMHARPLDPRKVNEHIRATGFLNDEDVTLLGIEKFKCTCGHNCLLLKHEKTSLPIQTIRIGFHIRGFSVLWVGRYGRNCKVRRNREQGPYSNVVANALQSALPPRWLN